MILVTVYRNQNEQYTGFDCMGHAGFAEAGEDIVCAGVSALVINTINSISCFTGEKFHVDSKEETGEISFRFQQTAEHDGELLMNALVLGLQGIQNNYGAGYITLNFKEG
ncbi:MAG: ribosomal-processing cysteine protease Prp [Lachnospiraceae bacterium]|nr:ribosomal-processing cysteine protease Prp [Lachnospiraceae bacterium]